MDLDERNRGGFKIRGLVRTESCNDERKTEFLLVDPNSGRGLEDEDMQRMQNFPGRGVLPAGIRFPMHNMQRKHPCRQQAGFASRVCLPLRRLRAGPSFRHLQSRRCGSLRRVRPRYSLCQPPRPPPRAPSSHPFLQRRFSHDIISLHRHNRG